MNDNLSAKNKLRVAFIGAGGISKKHAEGILENQQTVECVVLCDVSKDNLKARSEQLGGVSRHFSDWNKMFREMGDELDAVIICLPHHLHAQAICDAAKANKHVLCEKPICLHRDEADEVVRAVRQSKIIYMAAHNQLFRPVVRKAKKMIDSGVLGKIRWIRCQDCPPAKENIFAGKWRSRKELQGGGELIDTGYHPTYVLHYLAGSPVSAVRGSMSRFVHEIEGEDTASVLVRFENGVLGEIFTSWAVRLPRGTHQIHVVGEKGEVYGSGATLFHLPADADEPTKINLSDVKSMWVPQMQHFADCILNRKNPLHSIEEGRDVLKIILQATEDAKGWEATAPKQLLAALSEQMA